MATTAEGALAPGPMKFGSAAFAGGLVGLLLLMVVPLPTFLLDALLALNLTLGLVILLVAIYLKRPLDFTELPALVLISTLFRLCLNIASTRLILMHGATGDASAGQIIAAFGDFVIGGDYVVGIIVFVILIIINMMVITKGAGRVAEVSARFTLDALPGKQMAIDAELGAGAIDEKEAKKRREEVSKEAAFYGAMDGASKFVKGDAIAGILITVINIIGGFIIGMTQYNMPAGDAAATFTLLTVGDGLVSQMPALVISTAVGIIVTRATGNSDLGSELMGQLTLSPKALNMVGGILLGMGIMPGMPLLIFGPLGAGLLYVGRTIASRETEADEAEAPAEGEVPPEPTEVEKIEGLLPIDVLELQVGLELIALADPAQGGELPERILNIRRQLAIGMGVIIPSVHIRDSLQLPGRRYSILLKGVEIAGGEVVPDRLLAMSPGDVMGDVDGLDAIDPVYGLPGKWINPEVREQAESYGYTVVDAGSVVATHLSEVLQNHCAELLGHEEVQQLLEVLKRHSPKIVEALVPSKVEPGVLLRVLKLLLREQISIRDMRTILEAIADNSHVQSPEVISEAVRRRLAKVISAEMVAPDGLIHVMEPGPALSALLREQMQQINGDLFIALDPQVAHTLLEEVQNAAQMMQDMGWMPVVFVPPEVRRAVYNLLSRFISPIKVTSVSEIDMRHQVQREIELTGGLQHGQSNGIH